MSFSTFVQLNLWTHHMKCSAALGTTDGAVRIFSGTLAYVIKGCSIVIFQLSGLYSTINNRLIEIRHYELENDR